MTHHGPLDLSAPAPCVEDLLAPAGLHLCRCAQHGACSATRLLAARELTLRWATASGADSGVARHDTPLARALAGATARTAGVDGLEHEMGLLAELVSARNLRFGDALAVTLAVVGLEAARAA
jgi:hypothetical protein